MPVYWRLLILPTETGLPAGSLCLPPPLGWKAGDDERRSLMPVPAIRMPSSLAMLLPLPYYYLYHGYLFYSSTAIVPSFTYHTYCLRSTTVRSLLHRYRSSDWIAAALPDLPPPPFRLLRVTDYLLPYYTTTLPTTEKACLCSGVDTVGVVC